MRCRSASGFTLLELMAVASLVGVVVAASSVMLAQAARARQHTQSADTLSADADAALQSVVHTLRNTLRPRGDEQGAWFFVGEDATLNGRPAARLRFFTVDHVPVRPGRPESDVREAEFSLESGGPFGLPHLRRRLDPTLTLPPDEGGVTDRVAENVIAFDVTYFDGVRWVIDWPQRLNTMPIAARVSVAVADAEDPTRVVTQRRTVHLAHLPTLRQNTANDVTTTESSDANDDRPNNSNRSSGNGGNAR